jgi:hypothetical protein
MLVRPQRMRVLAGMFASNNYEKGEIGAVCVFTRNAGISTEMQKIDALGGPPPGSFGGTLAVSGDTAFVSALGYRPDTVTGWVYGAPRRAVAFLNGRIVSRARTCFLAVPAASLARRHGRYPFGSAQGWVRSANAVKLRARSPALPKDE